MSACPKGFGQLRLSGRPDQGCTHRLGNAVKHHDALVTVEFASGPRPAWTCPSTRTAATAVPPAQPRSPTSSMLAIRALSTLSMCNAPYIHGVASMADPEFWAKMASPHIVLWGNTPMRLDRPSRPPVPSVVVVLRRGGGRYSWPPQGTSSGPVTCGRLGGEAHRYSGLRRADGKPRGSWPGAQSAQRATDRENGSSALIRVAASSPAWSCSEAAAHGQVRSTFCLILLIGAFVCRAGILRCS